MKRFRFVASFVLFLGLSLGEGDECDIYVANAGAGNCVFVRFSAVDDGGSRLYRGLWVDCGFGKGGRLPDGFNASREWNEVVKGYFFGKGSVSEKVGKEDTMLWVTHLHDDHVNEVFSINKRGTAARREASTAREAEVAKEEIKELEEEEEEEEEAVEVRLIVVGIGEGEDGLPKGSPKTLKSIKGVLEGTDTKKVLKARVWEQRSKASAEHSIPNMVDCFFGRSFPHENIKLKPLIPTDGYGQGKKNLDANDTSLVLGLEYYGIKVLFPGDAPGMMYDYLSNERKRFVKSVDVLLAPHHGSESSHNSLWYSSRNRFCTIISGDPSFKVWGIPGPANYGFREWPPVRLRHKRPIYYSNARKDGAAFSEEYSWWPVFCTWDEKKKLVGYHIKIDSDEGEEKIKRISLHEILFKGEEEGYEESPIKVQELSGL